MGGKSEVDGVPSGEKGAYGRPESARSASPFLRRGVGGFVQEVTVLSLSGSDLAVPVRLRFRFLNEFHMVAREGEAAERKMIP